MVRHILGSPSKHEEYVVRTICSLLICLSCFDAGIRREKGQIGRDEQGVFIADYSSVKCEQAVLGKYYWLPRCQWNADVQSPGAYTVMGHVRGIA